jgi:hypothetical protein
VTRTHALDAASPAIDAGNNVVNLVVDRRDESYRRVVGAQPDIGAVEFDPGHVFGNGFGEPSP